MTRLRSEPGPSECWHCGEWGCRNKAGQSLYSCEHDAVDCGCDNDCSCSCHTWWTHVREAADEIERLEAENERLQAAGDEMADAATRQQWSRLDVAVAAWNEARRG